MSDSKEGDKSSKLEKLNEEKIVELFNNLDVDKDGRIDVGDMCQALKDVGKRKSEKQLDEEARLHHANVFVKQHDLNESGDISFDEFRKFIEQRHADLRITFSHFDRDKNGLIVPSELKAVCGHIGVNLSDDELRKLVREIGTDDGISWEAWRDYFLLHSTHDLKQVVAHWKHSIIYDAFGDAGLLLPDDFTAEEKESGYWWKQLVCGAIAGGVSRTVTAPVDRCKVYLQVYGVSNVGLTGTFRKLLKEGGMWGFWRGNGTNVVKIMPESAIKFFVYERMKKLAKNSGFIHDDDSLPNSVRFCCGATAGVVSQVSVYPLDVVKTRLALGRTGEYTSMRGTLMSIFKNEGYSLILMRLGYQIGK